MRVKLIGGVVLAAVGLALWRFMSGPADVPPTTGPVGAPTAVERAQPGGVVRGQLSVVSRSHSQPTIDDGQLAEALNERTLVGTKWEREGFGIEFGADGKLLIGGRERAQWRVEGSRIRLYRDTTGEEHWLDIVGDKLMWKGQEIGRVP